MRACVARMSSQTGRTTASVVWISFTAAAAARAKVSSRWAPTDELRLSSTAPRTETFAKERHDRRHDGDATPPARIDHR